MKNWDDKTQEIVGQCIDFDTEEGHNYIWMEENRKIEKFRVRHFHNGIQVGASIICSDREQAMAAVRLLAGDYADLYRGVG